MLQPGEMRFGENEKKRNPSITLILNKGSGLMTRQEIAQKDLALTNKFKYFKYLDKLFHICTAKKKRAQISGTFCRRRASAPSSRE